MNLFLEISDINMGYYAKKKKASFISDTIYTFDIETTSLFNYGNEWNVFNYGLNKDFYRGIEKIAIPYIWQFGIEKNVYYGRDFYDFKKVLEKISDKLVTKVIWVHNLSFEFGFLPNILNEFTIVNMCARDIRKPISFHIQELNITFRCSYMLTNLSLEKSAIEYTNLKKLDTLNYDNKIRTPLTSLTDAEMQYCEYDILCLYEIINHFRKEYGHIGKIPLTSTGEVREALRHEIDFYYIKKMWGLVPSPKMYLRLMACFQGGYTHANIINSNRVIKNVTSYDISSSYPTVMCLELFPYTKFLKITKSYYDDMNKDNKCFIFKIKIKEVKSRFFNNYISYSHTEYIENEDLIYDNGRIKFAHEIILWCTHVDLDIILKNYEIKSIEYLEIYYARADYLDKRIIKFILKMYKNKTSLKGVPDQEWLYKKSKAYINSLYGMSVTNPLKNSADYINNAWIRKELSMNNVNSILDETKKSFSTLFYYAVGVFVTAYARRNLYETIISSRDFDKHVIYCDTDSVKFYGDYDYIFDNYNNNVIEKYQKVCDRYNLKIDDFMPHDIDGKKHPLGFFENETAEGLIKEFKTLGAKKYCYVDNKGIHITVSGVSKNGSSALKSIDDFKKGFTWNYKECNKLQHCYNDNQPNIHIIDDEENIYNSNIKYGVILQPTTYTLGVTDEYLSLLEYLQERENRNVK